MRLSVLFGGKDTEIEKKEGGNGVEELYHFFAPCSTLPWVLGKNLA
jgi:hypothetical protein